MPSTCLQNPSRQVQVEHQAPATRSCGHEEVPCEDEVFSLAMALRKLHIPCSLVNLLSQGWARDGSKVGADQWEAMGRKLSQDNKGMPIRLALLLA